MLTEADTCRKYVVPLLQKAGWDEDPHSIAEQRCFTDGRIIVRGNQAERGIDFSQVVAQVSQPDAEAGVKKAEGQRPNAKGNAQQLASAFSLQHSAFPRPLPDVPKVPPISQHGKVNEIVGKFGGAERLREAVGQLQSLLYAE